MSRGVERDPCAGAGTVFDDNLPLPAFREALDNDTCRQNPRLRPAETQPETSRRATDRQPPKTDALIRSVQLPR